MPAPNKNGKKRDIDFSSSDSSDLSEVDPDAMDIDVEDEAPEPVFAAPKPTPKIKLKLGPRPPTIESTPTPKAPPKPRRQRVVESEDEEEEDVDDILDELENDVEDEEPEEDLSDIEDEEDFLEDEELEAGGVSRMSTPDPTKLTARQRAKLEDIHIGAVGGYMELSNEVQKKKHLSAAELALKRSEMARRRKNQSEKKLEEEKQETINKLLTKGAKSTRGMKKAVRDEENPDGEAIIKESAPPPPPTKTRWVDTKDRTVLAVPEAWMGTEYAEVFERKVGVPPGPRDACSNCQAEEGKYKVLKKEGQRACSIVCLKAIEAA
ncbi:hypothetical protein SAICODRAFT_28528 [Saitoella complicata NRRL Y-17804]|nr:uncharacterized protein SAICODRAFT_28528 [Saitoella complicata NRRL Y-17804]ODQ56315.1 hypothetical protein SAICODRAFT_28528 [Saitoella complicata NRRL Y-17804]